MRTKREGSRTACTGTIRTQKQPRDPLHLRLTSCFLSPLSAVDLNDARANIKIKKKRNINVLAPPGPAGSTELQGVEERRRRVGERMARKGERGRGSSCWLAVASSSHWASSSTSCIASLFCSSPSPCISEVHNVRLSRNNCMMSVESL